MADATTVLTVMEEVDAVDVRQVQVDFMATARKRFQTISAAESELRHHMQEDLRFRASDQWDEQTKTDRQWDKRPCITINRLNQFIRQVTNAQRASNLAVKVSPVDSGADLKTAEVFQGLIRHIEHHSDAAVAYQTAGDHQATIGRGYWRIVSEFDDETSNNQSLVIKRVRNPFTVWTDPAAVELDGRDMRYAFVVEDVPKEDYRTRFGDAEMVNLDMMMSAGDLAPDWLPEGKVRIAEYWYIDMEKDKLLFIQYPNGDTRAVRESILSLWPTDEQDTVTVLSERELNIPRVRMALINGAGILEGNEEQTAGAEWPGKRIPIIPVIGDEIDINGKLDLRGMVRDAKDPQRLYNYQNTALAETLALAPKAPFIGYEGQFEGHEKKWREANVRSFPYLEVKPMTIGGQPAPFPQRSTAEQPIAAIVAAIRQADNDLKATMGLYEPSLGVRDGQQSGKAIAALQRQGEMANSNFLDNMSRSIRSTGELLVDLIPHFYDVPRIVRILGDDDKERAVMVHSNAPPPETELPEGVEGIFNLGVGRYDVTISVGPSHATRRQESFEALTQFVQAYPAAFPILGDLIVGNLDFPGAAKAASRLNKMVPPEAQEEDANKPAIPPEIQQQLMMLSQQVQVMGQALKEAQDTIENKKIEMATQAALKREELASRERIEQTKAEVGLIAARAKSESAEAIAFVKSESARVQQQLTQGHEAGMADKERSEARADMLVDRAIEAVKGDREAEAANAEAKARPASE